MEQLLTPVGIFHEKQDEPDLVEISRSSATARPPKPDAQKAQLTSSADVLEVLRHEPGFDSLISVLRLLSSGGSNGSSIIHQPSPLNAQIVQVLVSDVVPNYWALLKEHSHSHSHPRSYGNAHSKGHSSSNDNNSSDNSTSIALLLFCLRSVTGLNAILVRLRALCQEAKADGQLAGRPDLVLNIGIVLELLCSLLQGDECLSQLWRTGVAGLDDATKRKALVQELLMLIGGGRLVSVSAEAEHISRRDTPVGGVDKHVWVAESLEYTEWLGRNIVQWQLSESDSPADESKFCSNLLAKALRLGHAEALVKLVLSHLLLSKEARPERMRALLDPLPQTEQRKITALTLKLFSEQYLDRLAACESADSAKPISAVAGAIRALTGDDKSKRDHLVSWLTSSSGAGLGEGVGIRRAVLSVLGQDRDAVVAVLEKSLAQFGDSLYIKHSPALQQEAHTQVLLISASYVSRKAPLKLTLLLRSSTWLNAISNRLAASNQRARFLGLVVGESLSSLVDKGDKALDFHIVETNQPEGLWYKGLTKVSDEPGSMDLLFLPQKSPAVPSSKPTAAKPTEPRLPAPPSKQGFIIEELDGDDYDDDDDDLVPYAKPDSDPEDSEDDADLVQRDRPKPPVYIRDLIRYLRNTESYDHQRLALATAPALIRRKAGLGTEVAEHAEELAALLVGLHDRYDTDGFYEMRTQGMLAVVVAQPAPMAPWFAKTFFDGDYSLSQRAAVLMVLGLAARELAGFDTSEHAHTAAFASKTLPERVERLFSGGGGGGGMLSGGDHHHNAWSSSGQALPGSSLKALPPNALDSVARSLTSDLLAPIAASAADAAALKLATVASRLGGEDDHVDAINLGSRGAGGGGKVRIKTRAKPRVVRGTPNTTAQLIATGFFYPLTVRFRVALSSSSSSSLRVRNIVLQPQLLTLVLRTAAILLHAAGPGAAGSLPGMTTELAAAVLGPGVRARAAGDLGVAGAALFALLVLLEVNEDRMRDMCADMGRELVEAQEWAALVFAGLRGGDGQGQGERGGAGEENEVKMLAAAVLIRLREALEKHRLLMAGDLIGMG